MTTGAMISSVSIGGARSAPSRNYQEQRSADLDKAGAAGVLRAMSSGLRSDATSELGNVLAFILFNRTAPGGVETYPE